jgi:ribonuclease III
MSDSAAQLQKRLAYQFSNSDLLELALTHRSRGSRNNERLEFLGDSILNHIVAEALYQKFDEAREGEMSRMRASLVKGDTLAEIGLELKLGECVKLGPGEMKSGGHRRGSILADTVEAIIGAILLDSDVERCREVVLELMSSRLQSLTEQTLAKDSKTLLQEYLQSRGHSLPDYQLTKVEGEDHCQEFFVSCEIPSLKLRHTGQGSSRRKAEQQAAQQALEELHQNG